MSRFSDIHNRYAMKHWYSRAWYVTMIFTTKPWYHGAYNKFIKSAVKSTNMPQYSDIQNKYIHNKSVMVQWCSLKVYCKVFFTTKLSWYSDIHSKYVMVQWYSQQICHGTVTWYSDYGTMWFNDWISSCKHAR